MRRRESRSFGRPSLITLCSVMLWSGLAWSAQLTLGGAQADAGAVGVLLPVSLLSENDESVASLQFDIQFDSQSLSVDAIQVGEAAQNANKTLSTSTLNPGHMRVIIAGFNQNAIANGSVARVYVTVGQVPDGTYPLDLINAILSTPGGQSVPVVLESGAILVGDLPVHSADRNGNYHISFSELLRVIQLFNAGGFYCQPGTEDGYALGMGDRSCERHSSDFLDPAWRLEISELLRLIQFYNLNGYEVANGTEDGFQAVSQP